MSRLGRHAWPAERVDEGLELCARRAGLAPRTLGDAHATLDRSELADHAEALGLELEPVDVPLNELEDFLARAAPVVIRLPGSAEEGPRYLFLLPARRRGVHVLEPDGGARRLRVAEVAVELGAGLRDGSLRHVDALLQRAGVRGRRARRAREALLEESLDRFRLGDAWLVRLPPGRSFVRALQLERLGPRVAFLAAVHALVYILWIAAWVALGKSALAGRAEPGWLVAFALLLASAIPFRALERWTAGLLSIDVGALLKRRLLGGALRLEPDEIRHLGAGQLLGRVLESEAVEALALSGGVAVIAAVVELAIGAWVLAHAPGALGLQLAFALAVATALAACALAFVRLRAFTRARVRMADDLVERMVGHRTRLAQESPERWHDGEDERLEAYMESSRRLDRAVLLLHAAIPSAWTVLGIAALGPALLAGGASPTGLAIGVGGVMLVQGALAKLVRGAFQVASLSVAWETVAPLFRAAAREGELSAGLLAQGLARDDAASAETALKAEELVFRHAGRERAVLAGAHFAVRQGARVLLEGPSGGGKSTLVSLLTGLRRPQGGLLLLAGLDHGAWGASGWRRRVAAAPQFHENHVFSASLAFNLLFGRDWPASDRDLAEAEAVCRELGLGPLLERMPSGLQQTVGETGWQLSHGERSRVFLARALLSHGEVTVLDESFATLDPETLRTAMRAVERRCRTLVCVAHP